MMTSEDVIVAIKELSSDEKERVFDFVLSESALPFLEDNSVGLEEDIQEHDKRLRMLNQDDLFSHEEMRNAILNLF